MTSNRPRRRRTHRTLSACILGTVAPLMFTATLFGMGQRAEVAAASTHHARAAVASIPLLQCLLANNQCVQAEANGDPCDPMPC